MSAQATALEPAKERNTSGSRFALTLRRDLSILTVRRQRPNVSPEPLDLTPPSPTESFIHSPMLRLPLLTAFASAGALLFGSPSAAAQTPLTTELFVGGLQSPVDLTFAPGDPDRVFIVEQRGRIRVVENGVLLATPFLDIDPLVLSGGERGLLGLAFHPGYATNGRFFVNFTNNQGDTRIVEFAASGTDPNLAAPAPVQTIAAIRQDFGNHNGGGVRFGADGMLYVGMGDGGSANDPNNRAQTGTALLGKMLRYDVDLPAPFVPADNPFVNDPSVADEVWFLGMRNPFRFNFDRMTGDMWIGDVGQGAREEVDFIPAGVGGLNLGWRCKEGTRCTGLTGCSCSNTALVDPIWEYNHSAGACSITGGVVYRGPAIPDLDATYFFADFCNSRIWSLRYDGTMVTDFTDRTSELRPAQGNITSISGFGEDFEGEVYIISLSGRVYKIVPEPPPCGGTNYCTATANSTGSVAAIVDTGSPNLSSNDFGLAVGGVRPNSAGLFVFGSEQAQVPTGDGNLCIGANGAIPLTRIPTLLMTDLFGTATLSLDFQDPVFATNLGMVMPGDTVNFQFWYRDTQAGMSGFNFSDGVSVLFCP